jgi:hypothetical protein
MPTETSASSTSDLVRSLYTTRPSTSSAVANREQLRNFEIETVIAEGDAAFVRYSAERVKDGVRFRNTEYVVCADGRVKAVEVYFGREMEAARRIEV